MLELDDVRAFCRGREVDLVMVSPPAPFTVCLHGEFDGYGDFFSLVARDVEYVDLPGGFPLGEMRDVSQVSAMVELSPKWTGLAELHSGPAVAFRSADARDWGTGCCDHLIIANHLEWRAGRDWKPMGRRAAPG
ncbi:MAG: hypothetical protein H6708_03105 [Kofleriaceae bacterium]|nr:hypothetical protein [Myxococcales bacterium]MCB9559381.1 hypothetical protein [Kofleriaceae bacterium]